MDAPFTHEIRVTWGDCDPAKIAYTGRIPQFALDAINAWWEHHLGEGWYQLELDRGIGTPFVHMRLDLRAPVTPRHRLVCAVWPTRLGETSMTFRVRGSQAGALCFSGLFVCVFTDAAAFIKRRPPAEIAAIVTAQLAPDESDSA